MKKQLLFAFFYLALSQYGSSQIDTTLLIDDIEIKENRLSTQLSESARNIQVIDKKEIASIPARNVSELLQYVGGIDLRRRGVYDIQSDISLRGGTFNQTLIMLNGVKMIDPQTGHHNFNIPIDLLTIERIEIIKGPASRVYGQNAFSGVINIITKIDDDEEIDVDLNASVGAWSTINSGLKITVPTGKVRQQVSLSHTSSDGYRHNTDFNLGNVFYQSEIDLGSSDLKITGGYSDRKFGANAFYANESATEQYEEIQTTFASAESTFGLGDISLTPRVTWRKNKDHYVYIRNNPAVYENFHTSKALSGELHGKYVSHLGATGVGIEWTDQDLESNNLGKRDRSLFGAYVEHRWYGMDEALQITVGAYLNKFSHQDAELYPGIDASYQLSGSSTLFASWNQANRIPTYTNLYYSSPVENGNENLVSESISAVELGWRFQSRHFQGTISGFYNQTNNLIDWIKEIGDEKWNARNFNAVDIAGVDFNLRADLSSLLNTKYPLSARLSYNYLDASIGIKPFDTVSRYALENLRHQLAMDVNIGIGKHITLSPAFRFIDRVSLDSYHLLDCKVSYNEESFSLFINGSNLTDSDYRETNLVPMPGRHFNVGIILR